MEKKKLNQIQREAKILLAQAIIKNWDKATEPEKKEIEKWWKANYKKPSSEAKETYGEFEKAKK